MKQLKTVSMGAAIVASIVFILLTFVLKVDVEWIMASAGVVGAYILSAVYINAFHHQKYDGVLEFGEREDGVATYNLVVNGDPSDWPDMDEILLKVQKKG